MTETTRPVLIHAIPHTATTATEHVGRDGVLAKPTGAIVERVREPIHPLALFALALLSACAPDASADCVTRRVLTSRIPAAAQDCGSFFIAATDGVNSIENPEAIACANRAIAAMAPFVVRRMEVVAVRCNSPEGMCPLARDAVSAWIGESAQGGYTVTQLFDNSEPTLPSMPLRAHVRACVPETAATLRLVSPANRRISIQCRDGAAMAELDERSSTSLCAPSSP